MENQHSIKCIINNLTELEFHVYSNIDKEGAFKEITLGEFFDYSLVISGNRWSKQIDTRHADLILKIQQVMCLLYSQAYDVSLNEAKKKIEKDLLIKVDVKEGSSWLDFLTKDFLEGVINKMNGTQVFVVVCFIIVGLFSTVSIGYLTKAKTNDKKTLFDGELEKQKMELEAKNRQKELEIMEKVLSQNPEIPKIVEAPARTLAKYMEDTDTVSISRQKPLTKERLKELNPNTREQHTKILHYVDATFSIKELKNDPTDDVRIASIATINGFKFDALIELNEVDREKLATAWNKSLAIELQVNVTISNNELREARIVSLGCRTENIKNIEDLVK